MILNFPSMIFWEDLFLLVVVDRSLHLFHSIFIALTVVVKTSKLFFPQNALLWLYAALEGGILKPVPGVLLVGI